MGCTAPPKQKQKPLPQPSTSTGLLKLTLTNAILHHQSTLFKLDPYLRLKLSNQQKISKVAIKGGKSPNFFETFTFFINSTKKVYGRGLEIVVMDRRRIGGDQFLGYGAVDLNPVVDGKKAKDEFRCILSQDYKQVGFVNIIAQFIEQPPQTLNFRFDQAIIRRNTSPLSRPNCSISLTIGQQTLYTKKHRDTKKNPPCWQDEVLSVKILPSIKECQIKVMDQDRMIGAIVLPMERFVGEGEILFVEDFLYGEGLYAGTLKFQTIKGATYAFLNPNMGRKTLEQKKNDQNDQNEQNHENYFAKEAETNHPESTKAGK